MEPFNNRVYSYVRVDGDTLKNINDNTKKIWEEAITKGVKDIIDVTEGGDNNKCYLVDTSVYHNLLQVAREGKNVDPYGIPNVNFTLIDRSNKRWQECYEERMERGFDYTELWSLYSTIARFIIPRLKAFKEETCSYPIICKKDEWKEILDKIIMAFEYTLDDYAGEDPALSFQENKLNRQKVIEDGLRLFSDNFCNLWT